MGVIYYFIFLLRGKGTKETNRKKKRGKNTQEN